MDNVHDEIISAMLEVLKPLTGEIRLLSRVNDECIGNMSETEVFFFVPDLHLISPEQQKRFGNYGFNYSGNGLLVTLLQRMAALGSSWDTEGSRKLVTIQLGDFFDMWREFPGVADPGSLGDGAYGTLRDILYRGSLRGKPCLKATMLLGNHDTRNGIPLPDVPFQLKAFNRASDDKPFLFTTHGDAFDMLEILVPEPIKEFAVYFVGDTTPVNKYPVDTWGKTAGKINKSFIDLQQAITEPIHELKGQTVAPIVVPGQKLPDILCREITSPDETDNEFFKKIYASLDSAAKSGLPGQNVKVVAIGHTHQTSMILLRSHGGGRSLLLMDVGAWIEQCVYRRTEGVDPAPEPSAQLGVIYGNDARIYQIFVPKG
jgi:hypothetical protein